MRAGLCHRRIALSIVVMSLGSALPAAPAPYRAVSQPRSPLVAPHPRPLSAVSPARHAAALAAYGRLPLRFEANRGQAAPAVRFLVHDGAATLFLTGTGAVLRLYRPLGSATARGGVPPARQSALRLRFVGANRAATLVGEGRLPGVSNYFVGRDRRRWRTNVPAYARVRYHNLYPGIDVVFYGRAGRLEYDIVAAPGADPGVTRLAISGARGVRLDRDGGLRITVVGGTLRLGAPLLYQQVGGGQRRIGGGYVLREHGTVGVAVGRYDHHSALVIDPSLSYSSFLGGGNYDQGNGVSVDSAGNAYLVGFTYSADFPTANAAQSSFGGGTCTPGLGGTACADAFVTKLSPAGNALLYSTYLGGSGEERAYNVALDSAGDAYFVGYTRSADFPTVNAVQPACGDPTPASCFDAFVTKLSPAGNALLYSTYLGGTAPDYGYAIGVDASGDAYVSGYTESANFPTVNAVQSACADPAPSPCLDAFAAKLSPDGGTLLYSTYLGGNGTDEANAMAVDAAGDTYIAGYTQSTNFPTLNALQGGIGGGTCARNGSSFPCADAFVTKLNSAGGLLYSTYLGGNEPDIGYGVAIDAAGDAYVTGYTQSTNFPTLTALQPACANPPQCFDAFVAKLSPAGNALLYSTYLGGGNVDVGYTIATDSAGNTYVTGLTKSANFPTFNAVQGAFGGAADAFVSKLTSAGALLYSTYLGGSGVDTGFGVAADSAGNAYVIGQTNSANFPTLNALQGSIGGSFDAFVAKINAGGPALSLAPASGSYSSAVAISGTGFGASEPIALTWDGATPLTMTTSAADGSFTGTITAPRAVLGPHLLRAVGQSSGAVAGAVFVTRPVIGLARYTVMAGTVDVAGGVGFAAGEGVTASLCTPAGAGCTALGGTTADATGSFGGAAAITFTVPARSAGTYLVLAKGQNSGALAGRTLTLHS